jgi:chemosensory pili system protein ChpA (sensor histidine kinase/response regulator)
MMDIQEISIMHEALDYNALSWVRQEIDVTLRQAHAVLVEYAGDMEREELLCDYADILHQLRGPLQIAELAGADSLVAGIEAVVSCLRRNCGSEQEATLAILAQSMKMLSAYLSHEQSGAKDTPENILAQVKVLHSIEKYLVADTKDVVISNQDTLPEGVFQGGGGGSVAEIKERAHAARVKFQNALVTWYRGGRRKKGVAELAKVLEQLQADARSEGEAILWWVGAGVSDALLTGLLGDSREIRQLFGQLDRQIKRLVENGDVEFDDTQTQALLKELLNTIAIIQTDDGRISEILATFRLGAFDVDQAPAVNVASQLRLENGPKEGVVREEDDGSNNERNKVNNSSGLFDGEYAWADESINVKTTSVPGKNYQEILRELSLVKEAIEEYSESSDAEYPLQSVTANLDSVRDNLRRTGLDREANVIASVQEIVQVKMIETMQKPVEEDLNRLAEAICSVEFYLECLRDGRIFGSRIIESAEKHVASLGFPVLCQSSSAAEQMMVAADSNAVSVAECRNGSVPHEASSISALQVVDPDADPEILQIFFDESATELCMLGELVPRLYSRPVTSGLLEEISRAFHTLKGNSRMLGANALGEFASVLEDLVNRAENGGVSVDSAFAGLLDQSCAALSQLVEQVKDPASEPDVSIALLASEAIQMSRDAGERVHQPGKAMDAVEVTSSIVSGSEPGSAGMELSVLAADADPEIVQIFVDEANEQVAMLANTISAWVAAPEQNDHIADVRRSMHTLKGSGRMAGALFMGEFAWVMEDLLNRVIDGSVEADETLYALVNKLPAVLKQLTEQVSEGIEPAANIRELISEAREMSNRTEIVSVSSGPENKENNKEEVSGKTAGVVNIVSARDEPLVQALQDQESSLQQIYTRECREILDTIRQYLDRDSDCGMVTEPLYRSLHTLAGISESAEVERIGDLASKLDRYFSNLYYTQGKLPSAALAVLRDSSDAIALQLDQLPDTSSESASIDDLCIRISMLVIENDQPADKEDTDAAACQEITLAEVVDVIESDTVDEVHHEDELPSIDQELFEIFLEEAAEIMDACERVLHAWAAAPDNRENLIEYQRLLHTLKGSARMMNITAIGDLSHSLETLLTRVVETTVAASADLFSALFAAQDQLSEMLGQVRQRHMPYASPDVQEILEKLLVKPLAEPDSDTDSGTREYMEKTAAIACDETGNEVTSDENQKASMTPDAEGVVLKEIETCSIIPISTESRVPAESMHVPTERRLPKDQLDARDEASGPAPASLENKECPIPLRATGRVWPERKEKAAAKRGEPVKVQSELLDDLVNYAGEINIYRSRMETQIGDYRFNLGELEQTINRLREQLRKLEMETEAQVLYRYSQEADRQHQDFDPLELDRYSTLQESSRSLMESISDLYSLLSLMENTTRDSETLLLQQSRVSADLHEGLMHTRMIPFAGLETRLKRIVRQSARQLDKKVGLVLQGADGEMDRAVIERIIAPLEHMLRNAVAHGIENPDDRSGKGKAETGIITIAFGREGPDIVLQISDDGSGMDVNAIREKAVEKGLLDSNADISDNDVTQFVLQTGFTTAREVTQISGRGVGLDVVNSEVKQLGGSLHIESEQGAGTVFTIRLPYTLAINQALLVKAGVDTYCVPLGNVEGVVRIHPEELLGAYATESPVYEYAGNEYQLKHLATLLNTDQLDASQMCARIPLLLMRVADRRIALHVESLLGSREIVIKPVGTQLNGIDGISGATILGDGGVAMILDVFALSRSNIRTHVPIMRMVSRDEKRLVVMVVDDSITVRKVTTRLLERNGYKVLTAKDGVDATGQLQACTPDIILLDVEMPRMDGFELATYMRNDDRLRHVPIVMITSRTGEKHRERARQIGVGYYLGKPYQEGDLLGTIDQIIRVAPDGGAVDRAEP